VAGHTQKQRGRSSESPQENERLDDQEAEIREGSIEKSEGRSGQVEVRPREEA